MWWGLWKSSSGERYWSEPLDNRVDLYIKKGGEFPLSNRSMLQILTAVLDKGLPFRIQARGFSMAPFISDGDIITLSRLEASPMLGDVVAFVHLGSDKLAIHRIIGLKRGAYLVKGDNVPEPDGLIPEKGILGRVCKVERRGKEGTLGLGPEKLFIAVLSGVGALPFLLNIYGFIRRRIL
jgi:hypothetical protein